MRLSSKIIDIVVNEALKSNVHRGRTHFKLGCVIFDKHKIISKGHNKVFDYDSFTFHDRRIIFWGKRFSVHAEMDAIIKAKTELYGASLLVVRISQSNTFCLAKPCKHCFTHIIASGIKNIFYSINSYPYFEEI